MSHIGNAYIHNMPVSTWKEIELSQRHLFFQSSFFPSLTALLSTPSLFSPIIYLLTICIHLFEVGRQTLLNEDVSHCFNLHVIPVCVATRDRIIRSSPTAKSDSGITWITIIFPITENTDPCSSSACILCVVPRCVKSFLVTVRL